MTRQATSDALGTHERASASKTPSVLHAPTALAGAPRWLPERLTLPAQQRWFFQVVTTPESEAAPIDAASVGRLLTAGPKLGALERIEIYRQGYHLRLIECLADDYPALGATLGEREFEALARSYIAANPSKGPNLNVFGQHMAEHLRASALTHASFLVELATLEWAVVQAIHAPSAPTLTPEGFAKLSFDRWPEVRLEANPSLRFFDFSYPVNRYFQAYLTDGKAPPVPSASATTLAVYRTGRSVWRLALTPAMVTLFSALAAGEKLGPALELVEPLLAGRDENEIAELVTGWFRHGVESGLFSRVVLG